MEYLPYLMAIAGMFLLTCSSPGPSFVLISSTTIAVSRRAGLYVGVGVATATLTWATAVVLGLGLLLTQIAWLYHSIKLAGAVYIMWLGIRMLMSALRPREPVPSIRTTVATPSRYFRRGLLLAVSVRPGRLRVARVG
jgi:threonine efflux protein